MNYKIFAGSGSEVFTDRICAILKTARSRGEAFKFSEGNLYVRFFESVYEKKVFLVQSIISPANEKLVEFLFWIDAFKRANAEVIGVIPFFSYAKGDKLDEPNTALRAKVCAKAIMSAGLDQLILLDNHSQGFSGFFDIPVFELSPFSLFENVIKENRIENFVIVTPDSGYAKKALRYADHFQTSLFVGQKKRTGHDEIPEVEIQGDLQGKRVIIFDDFVLTGRSLIETARQVETKGAAEIFAMITHGVFTLDSMASLNESPVQKIFVTDTINNIRTIDKIEVIPSASLFAEAISLLSKKVSQPAQV